MNMLSIYGLEVRCANLDVHLLQSRLESLLDNVEVHVRRGTASNAHDQFDGFVQLLVCRLPEGDELLGGNIGGQA